MRILKVTQSYAPFFEFGGPPVKVRALAERLAKRGHEVTVLTADWGLERRFGGRNQDKAEASPFGGRWRANGVTAEYLGNWFHYHALSWNPALGRYLRARLKDFDVAHIYGLYDFFGPRVAAECRKRGIPYVVEPIGMFLPIVRNIWLKKVYHRIWGRELLERAEAIIATGEQEREELVAGGLAKEKIVLRRNGVDEPSRLPERGAFRGRLGIAAEAKLILFLGRLSQKKSPDLLLRAFAGIGERKNRLTAETQGAQRNRKGTSGVEHEDPTCKTDMWGTQTENSVHLAFVGPDESGMKGRLEGMARGEGVAGRVHFCGPVDGEAKWAAYRDADIFVLPSQNENFGNTAAEAVATGTPVIVTDQCGIAPLLKGVAGLVVRQDEGELRQALLTLLCDAQRYAELQKGCSAAMSKLGWDEPVQQMELLYSGLAGARRP
jgi:glycosyltransferase involved in cell wall biosynthesis